MDVTFRVTRVLTGDILCMVVTFRVTRVSTGDILCMDVTSRVTRVITGDIPSLTCSLIPVLSPGSVGEVEEGDCDQPGSKCYHGDGQDVTE